MIRVQTAKVDPNGLAQLVERTLPEQGCVELQRDAPGKEHAWHQHQVDETIVVLGGSLRFYWEGGEQICKPGDVISLPALSRHGSVALEDGATYLIAMRDVAL